MVLPRGTVKKTFGGAEIQAIKTSKFLNKIGIHADIKEADAEVRSFSTYDVVHVFDHIDAFSSSRNAKKHQKTLVLTPIYWPETGKGRLVRKVQTYLTLDNPQYFFNQLRRPYAMTFYLLWRLAPDLLGPLREIVGQIWLYAFNVADRIIVNSFAEKKVLAIVLGPHIEARTKVVFNGVDEEIYGRPITEKRRTLFTRQYKIQDYVLSVGRIEPRKNQLMLIRACKELGLPCVLIGRQYDRHYTQKVFNRLEEWKLEYRHIHYLKPDSDMLASAYLNARVVALPSAFETPGLVALEAASLGRTVVVTKVGSAPEYFKDKAYYVDPESQRSITTALQTAWDKPFGERALSQFVLQNYTWKKAAEQTSRIYRELITERGRESCL